MTEQKFGVGENGNDEHEFFFFVQDEIQTEAGNNQLRFPVYFDLPKTHGSITLILPSHTIILLARVFLGVPAAHGLLKDVQGFDNKDRQLWAKL